MCHILLVKRSQNRLEWVHVLNEARGRYEVVNETGQKFFVQQSKILFKLQREHFDPPSACIQNTRKVIEDLEQEIDIELLWESIPKKQHSLKDLAWTYFGKSSGSEEEIALFFILQKDPFYFKQKGNVYIPRPKHIVDQLKHQHKVEEERKSKFYKWNMLLNTLLQGHQSSHETDPELEPLLHALKDWLYKRSSEDAQLIGKIFEKYQWTENPAILRECVNVLRQARMIDDELEGLLLFYGYDPHLEIDVKNESDHLQLTYPSSYRKMKTTFSIDDAETKEIDDAFGVEIHEDGSCTIEVYITCVSNLIHPGTKLDDLGERRVTSLYLPERVFYLFPEHIATNLGSLLEGELRPVIVLKTVWSPTLELTAWDASFDWIKIQHRLTYESAQKMLENKETNNQLSQALMFVYKTAVKLFEQRKERGGFFLQKPQLKVRVLHKNDEQEILIERINLDTPSFLMVREWMVFFNMCMGQLAREHGIPVIYRVQDPPETELDPSVMDPVHYKPHIFRENVRKLKRSSLWTIPKPHWGLGIDVYVQTSSPLRRYGDLIVQRQIHQFLVKQNYLYSPEELLKKLTHIEDRTLRLRQLEYERQKYWVLTYLKRLPGENHYSATVLEMKRKGFYIIELDDYLFEGVLFTNRELEPGQTITVRIHSFDEHKLNYRAELVQR